MGDKSKIEWCDATWNPLRGTEGNWHCTKVSEGCANCYAERINKRFGGPLYTVGADTFRVDSKALEQPLRWKKPRMIFVCSMTDLFHEDVTDEMIDQIFGVMALADRHTFQVLTKRSKRMREYFEYEYRFAMIEGNAQRIYAERTGEDPSEWLAVHDLPNVWLGVSVENQERAEERIPDLIQTPAAVRFLSVEPLLGPVKLGGWVFNRTDQVYRAMDGPMAMNFDQADSATPKCLIDWVIVGGESGHGARPMCPDWARSIRDQCKRTPVSYFFKQWGMWVPFQRNADRAWGKEEQMVEGIRMFKVGKKKAGRVLDGRTWDEMPKVLETR